MNRYATLLCGALLTAHAAATPTYQWVARAGGPSPVFAAQVIADAAGNTYVTGEFEGTAAFGSTSLVSAGGRDIYLAKLNPNGSVLWARRAGGAANDLGAGVAIDSSGNVYVTGAFSGTATFGSITRVASGGADLFVAKYDAAGNALWVQRGGGASVANDFAYAYGIGVDDAGNSYITGAFYGAVTCGSTSLTSAGDYDVLVAKLNAAGSFAWAKRAGGIGYDAAYGLAANQSGAHSITGEFYSRTIDFDSFSLVNNRFDDIFTARYQSSGTVSWAAAAGGTGYDYGNRVAVDDAGNTYLTGGFQGSATFGTTVLTAASSTASGICAVKYDHAGTVVWAVTTNQPGAAATSSINVDRAGNSYVISGLDTPHREMFAVKLDLGGAVIWAKQTGNGSDGAIYGRSIAVDPLGNSYSLGELAGGINFDFIPVSSASAQDIVVAKLNNDNGVLHFFDAAYSVFEDDGNAVLTVTRSDGAANAVTVAYSTSNGSATSPADYSATSGTLNFAAGQTSATIAVPIVNDAVSEGAETFRVALSNPTAGALLGSAREAVVTIENGVRPVTNAAFISQAVPTVMTAGQGYQASITLQNTGNTTWTFAGDYKLGSQNPQDNTTWGFNRVLLPEGGSVAPGQSHTFTFIVTAPASAGDYGFQWQMLREGVAFFGALTPSVAVTVNPAPGNAAFVSQTVPAEMTTGQVYQVSVTLQNNGSSTWRGSDSYMLGSQNPENNTTWGFNRVLLPDGVSVAPGASHTFTFNVTAPATAGSYSFQWRMLREGVAWFGEVTPAVPVSVTLPARNAAFVSQTAPTEMVAGQTYSASVTVKNTGTATWTSADLFALGSQNPQDNINWGFNRVLLGNDTVAPGQNYTFTFNVTAPSAPGTYGFQWRMIQEGIAWFGELTPSLAITVAPPPTPTPTPTPAPNATFVEQNVPAVMTPGQTYNVSVTMTNTGNTAWTYEGRYKLGSQNPRDNVTWGLSRVLLPAGVSIAPGQTYTFDFMVTAPATAGTYAFQWRMLQETTSGFGNFTPTVTVNVAPPPAPNAAFVSQNVPQSLQPGETRAVSVTMSNTGNTTWTWAGSYKLGSQNPRDNTTWGLKRVSLPTDVSVAPGQSYTFNFNITAPATVGAYAFQWRMLQETTSGFGNFTPTVTVNVAPPPAPNAAFVSQNVPQTLEPGETRAVSVTMTNTGNTTWTWAGRYKLGSQNPRDNTTWGLSRVSLPTDVSVAPGQSYTFNFTITAPTTAGTYAFQWRMLQEGAAGFGSFTPNVSINVAPPAPAPVLNASFVSQTVPQQMTAGQQYSVQVTMTNTGTTTWTWAERYKLGSQNPRDNTTWGFNRVLLPTTTSVAPGQSHTFAFTVTAPATPGTYPVQWRMLQEGVTGFGAFTSTVSVVVQ